MTTFCWVSSLFRDRYFVYRGYSKTRCSPIQRKADSYFTCNLSRSIIVEDKIIRRNADEILISFKS